MPRNRAPVVEFQDEDPLAHRNATATIEVRAIARPSAL
jgi:hypothetical protein